MPEAHPGRDHYRDHPRISEDLRYALQSWHSLHHGRRRDCGCRRSGAHHHRRQHRGLHRLLRSQVITAACMAPGDVIVGFSSTGRAAWETVENSGIGSNGLTSARHELLSSIYRQRYPESFRPRDTRRFGLLRILGAAFPALQVQELLLPAMPQLLRCSHPRGPTCR